MSRSERVLFVTGRLAEPSLRRILGDLERDHAMTCEVAVVGVTVAALMTESIVRRRLAVRSGTDRVILPGWYGGSLEVLERQFGMPFLRGPKDLHDLPEFFGAKRSPTDLSSYDIDILAEINHVPRLSDCEIDETVDHYLADGADIIDLGCDPGESWRGIGPLTRRLRDRGIRVSVDSFDQTEVEAAVSNGAELVLSCNSTNADWLGALGVEVVVIPDQPSDWQSLENNVERLEGAGVPFRIDPILEPIGCGFAESLDRYFRARQQWPEHPVMMGVGNLTEMTQVDSAGVNFILAGICQEVGITSVLTTEVINWARSSVQELDLARRLVHHSIRQRVVPKHLDERLVVLRDSRIRYPTFAELAEFSSRLADPNFRIDIDGEQIHLMNGTGHWADSDPFVVFDAALAENETLAPDHAFYLGFELCKAATALQLGKRYRQDESLRWGFLTRDEESAIDRRHRNKHDGAK